MTWKFIAIAAVSMILGAVVGYLITGKVVKELRKKIKLLKSEKPPKKGIGAMDKILILEAILLIAYTIADLIVFWHTGAEPYTLTTCVFAVCGLENGVMGWIKTNKDKLNQDPPTPPDPERPEPPDAGL